jgi:hypothetical protein
MEELTVCAPAVLELSGATLAETASEVCRCRFFPPSISPSRPGAAVTVSDLFLPSIVCFGFAGAFFDVFPIRVEGGAGLDRVFILIHVE